MRMYVFRRYATEQYVFSNIRYYSKFISLYLFIYFFKGKKRENIILYYFKRKVSLRNIQFLQAAVLPSNQIICNLANTYVYIHVSIYYILHTD